MAASMEAHYSVRKHQCSLRIDRMAEAKLGKRTPIRVLLADDHAIVRGGVSQVLNDQTDIEIVAEAADGESAITMYRRGRPGAAPPTFSLPPLPRCSGAGSASPRISTRSARPSP